MSLCCHKRTRRRRRRRRKGVGIVYIVMTTK
jgi:hypothetical protein